MQFHLFESPRHKAALKLLPNLEPRPTLWLSQVEEYLRASQSLGDGLSKQKLIRMIESGELAGTKVGSQWLVDRESFQQYLAAINQRLRDAMGVAA